MLIPTLTVTLSIPWATSLKDKRQVMRSLIDGISHTFRVAVAESDHQDFHQSAQIMIVSLSNSTKQGDSILEHMVNYIESHTEAEIIDIQKEYR